MREEGLTHEQERERDAVYREELLQAPRFTTVDKMEEVALALRKILVRRYPYMEQTFREIGLAVKGQDEMWLEHCEKMFGNAIHAGVTGPELEELEEEYEEARRMYRNI